MGVVSERKGRGREADVKAGSPLRHAGIRDTRLIKWRYG